jgi:DNA repair exonuclease SbcCD ATPase subunit
MTDKEIIKYFNLCLKYDNGCKDCGFKGEVCDGSLQGKIKTLKMVSDLINRQQAENIKLKGHLEQLKSRYDNAKSEIERLNNNISAMATTMRNSAKETRAEAIKEFAERLKQDTIDIPNYYFNYATIVEYIDNLVKEMVVRNDEKTKP